MLLVSDGVARKVLLWGNALDGQTRVVLTRLKLAVKLNAWPMHQLTLPLFVAGILAHDKDHASAPNNLAAFANAFNAGTNLHGTKITFSD